MTEDDFLDETCSRCGGPIDDDGEDTCDDCDVLEDDE